MKIELTEQERQLLFQTVATSSYVGQLAELVVSVLAKLKGPDEEVDENLTLP